MHFVPPIATEIFSDRLPISDKWTFS